MRRLIPQSIPQWRADQYSPIGPGPGITGGGWEKVGRASNSTLSKAAAKGSVHAASLKFEYVTDPLSELTIFPISQLIH